MTTQEIKKVKELVLRELPQILAQDTEFALMLEGMLSERFPRRDEFARLLDEMKEFRSETKGHFDQVDRRLDQVDQRFGQVDTRFDQVDKRFDQVDKRFEKVDQRFEKVDQRFEKVDQRFENIEQQLTELKQELKQEIAGLRNWMALNVGGFQNRAGKRLEDVVAGAFCYGLNRDDIRPDQVKLRQKITDTKGVVYRAGKIREVDIIASGQGLIVFEVKSTADLDDIDDLADKVQLVRHLNPGMTVDGVLVMLGADNEHRQRCTEHGLRLIP